ncbi:sulfurtransferase TusA family protein [Oscillatoria sp. CS-180]|uniref:sulfurtransferase TusA family protein n=1 Tax=Oscillatoria sp. CS-180 TaxID=3021720 RepID=UPI00232C8E9D|nr:sulfurtransferase TusA family protein [Oscillatoria sp. CS-180]MDB9524498.1 sulfurtransferase TusA family protein [Oscillatoria sp. CS-180]
MSESVPTSANPTSPSSASPDKVLDLRGTPCPINFVRTKLQLQQMVEGALLEVWIDAGEPVAQVPDSLKMDGYSIEQLTEQGSYYALQVRNSQS